MKALPLPTPLLSRLPTPLLSRLPTPLLSRLPTPLLSRLPTPLLPPLPLRPRPALQVRPLPQARPLPQTRFQTAVRLSLFSLLPFWFSWRLTGSDQPFQRSRECGRGSRKFAFVCLLSGARAG